MTVETCAGVWRTRAGELVTVLSKIMDGFWACADGSTRRDNGAYRLGEQNDQDLVAFVSLPEPQPQPDAADELAGLRDDRDRWQARAKQAEGQASNLAQELVRVRGELREAQQQLTAAQEVVIRQRQGWEDLQQQLTNRVRQVSDLQAQLEAAVHAPDLSADLERVAAERDAAREEVRGLQVRAEQAEGDARNATAKLRHHEHAAARWEAYSQEKNNLLLKAEGAANALQLAILNIVREVANHDD